MPTNRHRRMAARRGGGPLPEMHVLLHLIFGPGHHFADRAGPPPPDLAEQWDAWREVILDGYVFGYCDAPTHRMRPVLSVDGNPGHRPGAWWLLDAAEPRRRIADVPEPYTDHPGFRMLKGVPKIFRHDPRWPDSHIISETPRHYESESDLLTRLNLWLPGERELWVEREEVREEERRKWREKFNEVNAR